MQLPLQVLRMNNNQWNRRDDHGVEISSNPLIKSFNNRNEGDFMDIGKAFTYIFDDQEWLMKVGIAALVTLIPIIGTLAVLGWMLEITRRVIQNQTPVLPAWDNFGGYLSRGFMAFVIGFIYALPVVVISACMQGALVPLYNQNNDAMNLAASGLTLVLGCLSVIYGILLGLVLPAAFARYADTGVVADAFKFTEVFKLVRAAPSAYLLVLIGSLLASVAASLGFIACFIGILFTSALAMAVNGHLYGQAYNVARGAAPAM
jgi:hypothetical protein